MGAHWNGPSRRARMFLRTPEQMAEDQAFMDELAAESVKEESRPERCAVCGGINCRSPRCQDSTW